MSLFSLKDIRNHASRSGFDLSSKVAFTAKAGEILPVKRSEERRVGKECRG